LQAEDGIRDPLVTGVQTCALPISQGVFGFGALVLAGLQEWGLIRLGIPGLDNVVNFLGRGIHFADVVNTVSERYAKEIQTPEFEIGRASCRERERMVMIHGCSK